MWVCQVAKVRKMKSIGTIQSKAISWIEAVLWMLCPPLDRHYKKMALRSFTCNLSGTASCVSTFSMTSPHVTGLPPSLSPSASNITCYITPNTMHALMVSCPDYFSHAEGKSSLVNCLFNFCSVRFKNWWHNIFENVLCDITQSLHYERAIERRLVAGIMRPSRSFQMPRNKDSQKHEASVNLR